MNRTVEAFICKHLEDQKTNIEVILMNLEDNETLGYMTKKQIARETDKQIDGLAELAEIADWGFKNFSKYNRSECQRLSIEIEKLIYKYERSEWN